MNVLSPLPLPEQRRPRSSKADFTFRTAGGRSFLSRQFASYPFHVTRPFYLDRVPPGLATLYLQSVAGGLYSGDSLDLALTAEAGAQFHVTSQASTIVHECRGEAARQRVSVDAAAGSFAAYLCDPVILFSGAALESRLSVTLAEGAVVLVADSFLCHDPRGQGRLFDGLLSEITVRRPDGKLLMVDRMRVGGGQWHAQLKAHAALGSFYALGLDAAALDPQTLAGDGAMAGASALPNGCGAMIRFVARDGAALLRALDTAFTAAFTAAIGSAPVPRRK